MYFHTSSHEWILPVILTRFSAYSFLQMSKPNRFQIKWKVYRSTRNSAILSGRLPYVFNTSKFFQIFHTICFGLPFFCNTIIYFFILCHLTMMDIEHIIVFFQIISKLYNHAGNLTSYLEYLQKSPILTNNFPGFYENCSSFQPH